MRNWVRNQQTRLDFLKVYLDPPQNRISESQFRTLDSTARNVLKMRWSTIKDQKCCASLGDFGEAGTLATGYPGCDGMLQGQFQLSVASTRSLFPNLSKDVFKIQRVLVTIVSSGN